MFVGLFHQCRIFDIVQILQFVLGVLLPFIPVTIVTFHPVYI